MQSSFLGKVAGLADELYESIVPDVLDFSLRLMFSTLLGVVGVVTFIAVLPFLGPQKALREADAMVTRVWITALVICIKTKAPYFPDLERPRSSGRGALPITRAG